VTGGRLTAYVVGAGDPVVLLNAASMDARMWDGTVGWLSARHRVVRYDPRGRGRSAPPTAGFDPRLDLLAVLDACDVHRAMLVGCSDGGRLALETAAEHPDRVRAVVTVGTVIPADDPGPEERRALAALVAALAPRDRAAARGDLAEAVRVDLAVWAPAQADGGAALTAIALDNPAFYLLEEDLAVPLVPGVRDRLDRIDVPVTAMVGDRDVEAARVVGRTIARQAPRGRFVLVPGADHFAATSAPVAFRRRLEAALAET
jgi:pimeloyl-ACP methyl ester carboxylesterase